MCWLILLSFPIVLAGLPPSSCLKVCYLSILWVNFVYVFMYLFVSLFCFSIHFGSFIGILLIQLIKYGPANSESLWVELLIQSHLKFPDSLALTIFLPHLPWCSLNLLCRSYNIDGWASNGLFSAFWLVVVFCDSFFVSKNRFLDEGWGLHLSVHISRNI